MALIMVYISHRILLNITDMIMYVSPYVPRDFTYKPCQSLRPTCGYMGAYVGSGFFLMVYVHGLMVRA